MPAWKQVASRVISPLYVGSQLNIPLPFSPVFFLHLPKCHFSGPHKLVFSSPIGSLGGRVRAQRFHSAPRRANGNWGRLFHFPPASYIIRNFRQADYSERHLLSRWYLAWLIRPWRWVQCSSETSTDFQRTTERYIPECSTLHNYRCENLKYYIF
jgi:hypothetical protein